MRQKAAFDFSGRIDAMVRELLYGFLGFIIFGIIGVMAISILSPSALSNSIYPTTAEQQAARHVFELAGLIGLTGALVFVAFARWMNKRGEQVVENFSSRPKMIYGIIGSVIGIWIGFFIIRKFDPNDMAAGIDLLFEALCIVFCGWIGFRIARVLDLPTTGALGITAVSRAPVNLRSVSQAITREILLMLASTITFAVVAYILLHLTR